MSSKLSVEEVLANLEQRVTFHRDQEVFHAQQAAAHQEQRSFHAAALAKAQESLVAFRAAALSAVELATPASTRSAPGMLQVEMPPQGRLRVSRLLRQVALSPDLAEPFGPGSLAAAANRAFSDRLDEPVGKRAASDVLRRMLDAGEIELARDGKAFYEALYVRSRQQG